MILRFGVLRLSGKMVSEDIRKMLYVFMLLLVWVSMGLYSEITGPTMIDIKLIFSATYEDVSRSMSGRGVGGFVGSLLGGFLVDRFSHSLDLLIALSETFAGLAIMFVPYTFTVNTIWFHYFTIGVCNGIAGIAGIRSVTMLWPEKAAVNLQLIHVGYGVGALLVPLVADPFLATIVELPKQNNLTDETEHFEIIEETRVQYAYVVIGIATILLSMAFYRFHFQNYFCTGYKRVKLLTETPGRKLTFKEMVNPATYANGQFWYGLYVLFALFMFYFFIVGGLETFSQFVRTFSVEVFKFPKTKASYLNMTFWLGLTIGRLISSVLFHYLPIRNLFMFQVILHTLSTIFLNVYASLSPTSFWCGTAVEGLLISPLSPGGIAYGNTFMEISGMCLMLIHFAGSFGDLTFIWIEGKLYDTYGPGSVLYVLQFIGICMLVCAVLLKIGERFKKEKEKEILVEN